MLVARSRSPSDGGGAGRRGTAASRLRRRSASTASRAWAACSGQRSGTTCPCLPLRRPRRQRGPCRSLAAWSPWAAWRARHRFSFLPIWVAHWPEGPPRRAAAAARAAAPRRTAATVRAGSGPAQQFLGGLVGEGGDLALGRQPVPPQDVPPGRVTGVLEEHLPPVPAVGRGPPTCPCACRRGPRAPGSSAARGLDLPYQSPPIFTPRAGRGSSRSAPGRSS